MIALCCTDRTGSEIRLLRHFSERLRAIDSEHFATLAGEAQGAYEAGRAEGLAEIEGEHASPCPEADDYVEGV